MIQSIRVRARKDRRGFDLISEALPFGGLWNRDADAAVWANAPILPDKWLFSIPTKFSRLRFSSLRVEKFQLTLAPC